ncbi:hypothetical protein [Pseudarthrobacter sp. 1C304]|uniref:hypothetical protein n=1 Tax=Pseudarthrobacter sp. 1C304 TaxID=3457438 RepID=UPI003FD04788
MAIDAKLGAVEAGAATLESEFLAHVVLPGNCTVLDELEPVLDAAYRSGRRASFGGTDLPARAAELRIAADSPNPRGTAGPAAPGSGQTQQLQNLSAQGVGRILRNMVQSLGDHDNFTRQQMLEIIDRELWRDQLGGGWDIS